MKQFIISVLMFVVCTFCNAQKKYLFTPKWEVGEVKDISITTTRIDMVGDSVTLNEHDYRESKLKVLSQDDTSYTVALKQPNVAMRSIIKFYEGIGDELPKYKTLLLKYSINKKTGKPHLLNGKQIQKFMNDSFDQIVNTVSLKDERAGKMCQFLFLSLRAQYEDEKAIEGMMNDEIAFLVLPYGMNYTIGDTITVTESQENPFKKGEKMDVSADIVLSKIDKGISLISQTSVIDMSQVKEMIKQMMEKMFGALAEKENVDMSGKLKEIDELEMNAIHTLEVNYNNSTTWVDKSVKTILVNGYDPKEGARKSVSTIITVVK